MRRYTDPETQYKLGNDYYNGRGVKKDYKKAVEWHEEATEQGYTVAEKTYEKLRRPFAFYYRRIRENIS